MGGAGAIEEFTRYPSMYILTVSRASKATYTDHGINHSWEGGNGLSSPFVYMDGGAKQEAIEV